jgi:hypothetical protein
LWCVENFIGVHAVVCDAGERANGPYLMNTRSDL